MRNTGLYLPAKVKMRFGMRVKAKLRWHKQAFEHIFDALRGAKKTFCMRIWFCTVKHFLSWRVLSSCSIRCKPDNRELRQQTASAN